MNRIARIITLLTVLMLPLQALAGSTDNAVKARILPGWQMADGSHMTALQVELSDGWKTYWRAPGDAGIPPRFNWSGSRNVAGVVVKWPTPKIMLQSGVKTIGYANSLTLPLNVTPTRRGAAIRLAGEVELGVCKEVCIPVTLKLHQNLPRGKTKPDPKIAAALAARPYSAAEAGVGRVACTITPMEEGLHLRAEVDVPSTGGREIMVIETDNPRLWVAQAKTSRKNRRLIAETDLYHVEGRAFALNRAGLRITVLGKSHAVDIQGCPAG